MNINKEILKRDLLIPKYIQAKLNDLGITELPAMKELVVEYIDDTSSIYIEWWDFHQWVMMNTSNH